MKIASLVLAITFLLTACGPKQTWDYVVIGDNLQLLSTVVKQYAAHIEKDQRVEIVIHDYAEKASPASWMLRNMQYHDEFRAAIANAEVITINWHAASADLLETNFIKGECGGADNQDCLREGYAKAKEDWAGMLDAVADLRNGSPTILRILVVGDWVNETGFYSKQLSVEQIDVFNTYLRELQNFIVADANARRIPVLLVFPEPYYNSEVPPADYFQSEGVRLSDSASKLVADGLRDLGYEFIVLK
ncbi:MAG: hypothetical protein L0287_15280 [Anaerolineae bacterium]|nr:hypothetical protein [Anaerolineae bacterium]